MKKNPAFKCRACTTNENGERYFHIPGFVTGTNFLIYQCGFCGTLNAEEPPENELNKLYDAIYKNSNRISGYKRYDLYAKLSKKARILPFLKAFYFERSYFDVWSVLRTFTKGQNNSKILEIGSGLGYMTYALNITGTNATGVDISKVAITNSIENFGENYLCENIYNWQPQDHEKFDIAICMEIIEHIDNPINFLKSALDKVKQNGVIILSTPYLLNDGKWISTEPPVHLTLFSVNGLIRMAEKLNCNIKFYSTNGSKNILEETHDTLPGGVLNKDYSYNENYFDNGEMSKISILKVSLRSLLNFFRFRLDPTIQVSIPPKISGSVIFSLSRK